MKHHAVLGTSIGLLLTTPVSGEVVLDFDELNGSAAAWNGDNYTDLGVEFSTLQGAVLRSFGNGTSTYGNNFIYGSFLGADAPVIATFAEPANWVSFHVIDSDSKVSEIWTAEAFDIHGNLIDSVTGTDGAPGLPTAQVIFETESIHIHRVEFTPSSDNEGIDNFAFVTVPSPGTGLISISSLGMMLSRRRRS